MLDNKSGATYKKQWYLHQLSQNELRIFVEKAKSGKNNESVFIGTITCEAAQRIKLVCGIDVEKIMLDSGAVRHSYNKDYHLLEKDDIFYYMDVVNTAVDIELSKKKHFNNNMISFTKDVNGKIKFITEVRAHYGGWLSLITCYRLHKKK